MGVILAIALLYPCDKPNPIELKTVSREFATTALAKTPPVEFATRFNSVKSTLPVSPVPPHI